MQVNQEHNMIYGLVQNLGNIGQAHMAMARNAETANLANAWFQNSQILTELRRQRDQYALSLLQAEQRNADPREIRNIQSLIDSVDRQMGAQEGFMVGLGQQQSQLVQFAAQQQQQRGPQQDDLAGGDTLEPVALDQQRFDSNPSNPLPRPRPRRVSNASSPQNAGGNGDANGSNNDDRSD
jgi:hypothetical protein